MVFAFLQLPLIKLLCKLCTDGMKFPYDNVATLLTVSHVSATLLKYVRLHLEPTI